MGNILEQYASAIGVNYYHTHYSDKYLPDFEGMQLYTSADYKMIPDKMRSGLHIIRNPLDIVVSSYFSHLKTHSTEGWTELEKLRAVLQETDKKLGIYLDIIFLERTDFYSGAIAPLSSIRTWNYEDSNFINIRMEDLVENPEELLVNGFLKLGHEPERDLLKGILQKNTFENLSKGRSRGNENGDSHYRKGIPNDWVNHLDQTQANLIQIMYREIFERFYPDVIR